jgi:AraC family transcriptional regulator
VLEYIDAHLTEELDVERLSGVAAFSKYHFHRQFSELFGIGVCKYVQLNRMKRASYQLAFRDSAQIVDIACAIGYEGPEAFARAFKKTVGQSPTEFRKQPDWHPWSTTYRVISELRAEYMKSNLRAEDVRVIDFKETKVAALEYRGDPRQIGNAVRSFIEWRKRNNLPPRVSATFNVVYDHPVGPEGADCHYDLCAATEKEIAENSFGVIGKRIPAGRCAVLRHVGSDDMLAGIVSYLYAEWLPQSGAELRDFPLYYQRVSFFPDVPENAAITDVFLPLK